MVVHVMYQASTFTFNFYNNYYCKKLNVYEHAWYLYMYLFQTFALFSAKLM